MVGVKPDGSPLRKSFYGKTQGEAKKKFQDFQAKRHGGIILKPQSMTLGMLVERWLELKRKRDAVSENTFQQYKYGLGKFKALYKQRLDKITPFHIDQIYAHMLKEGLSPRSVQVAHRSLYGGLKQAVACELVGRNVLESVKVPKQIEPEVAFWTVDEVACFLSRVQPHRLYGLFYTAVVTGMRRGELVALRWQDVDVAKKCIYVRHNAVDVHGTIYAGEPKTKASRRIIHVQEGDIQVLLQHQSRLQAERAYVGEAWSDFGLVFPSQLGTYLNPRNLSRVFERIVKEADRTCIGIHGLRHTYASLLIKNGIDTGVVSERLGHTNSRFTRNIYQHLCGEQRSQAALGLATLLQGVLRQEPLRQLSAPN